MERNGRFEERSHLKNFQASDERILHICFKLRNETCRTKEFRLPFKLNTFLFWLEKPAFQIKKVAFQIQKLAFQIS